MKIIIIGAGIAGIHAAKTLEDYSKQSNTKFKVTILEAKSRPGGRTTSRQFGDIPIDCGASWMEGIDTSPLYQLVGKFNLFPKHPSGSLNASYHNGKLVENFTQSIFSNRFHQILQGALSLEINHDMSLKDAIDMYLTQNKIVIQDHERSLFDSQLHFLQGYNGCLISDLSTKSYSTDNGYTGESMYMDGNFGKLVEKYSQGLNIVCDQIVTKVDYSSESNIFIHTKDDKIYECDFVICTVPIGCLKKSTIEFLPSLPKEKVEAIDKIGWGVLDKLYIEFPERFWSKDISWIEIFSGLENFRSFLTAGDTPILIGFINSEFAKEMESLDEEKVVERACVVLRSIFGDKVGKPVKSYMTRWWNDPFAYGSYTHFKVGNIPHDYDVVGTPIENRVFFAGEGTISRGCSFVNGAYLSGERDAKRIIDFVNKK